MEGRVSVYSGAVDEDSFSATPSDDVPGER